MAPLGSPLPPRPHSPGAREWAVGGGGVVADRAGQRTLRTISLPKNVFDATTRISMQCQASLEATAEQQPEHAAGVGEGGGTAPQETSASHPSSPSGDPAAVSLQVEASQQSQGRLGPPTRPASHPGPRSIFGLPIVSCYNRGYRSWSLAVLLLDLTYTAYVLPISIGFEVNDLEWTWACYVDLAAGAVFAAELMLGFHVSFVATSHGHHQEVSRGRHVAAYYIRHGSFWQDLLSTAIWVTQIALLVVRQASGVHMRRAVNAFQYVRIIRMVRFFSVLRSLFALTVGAGSQSVIPGLRLGPRMAHVLDVMYAGAVLINFWGCVWNFVAIQEGFDNTWMNPVAQLIRAYGTPGASVLTPAELAAVPATRRYLTGVYFSLVTIATLGYGDITPSTAVEVVLSMIQIVLGVLIFGLIMGSISDLVSHSSKEARQAQMYRQKIEKVDAWMRASRMPKPLKAKVRSYYAEVWVKHAELGDAGALFGELPHKLRQEISWELNRHIMERLPLFSGLEEGARFALASLLGPVELTPGQELALRGDEADRLWLLHEGEMQVLDDYDTVRVVEGPEVVGGEALLQHCDPAFALRQQGYRTGTTCTVWELHLRDALPFLAAHPDVLSALISTLWQQQWGAEGSPRAWQPAPSSFKPPPLGEEQQERAGQAAGECSPGEGRPWEGSPGQQDKEAAAGGGLSAAQQQQQAGSGDRRPTITITADARAAGGGGRGEPGSGEASYRPPDRSLPADPGAAATAGELHRVAEGLKAELLGQLERLLTELQSGKGRRRSSGGGSTPPLAAALPPSLAQLGRGGSFTERRASRTSYHRPPQRSGGSGGGGGDAGGSGGEGDGMRWSYSMFH